MTRFSTYRNFVAVAAIFSLAFACGLSESMAGPLSVTSRAFNNTFGPDAGQWHGSVSVASAAFGNTVVAEVDWAVFGPGDFQLYLDDEGIAEVDPSAPNELTYVYQIHSVTQANPGIDSVTVGVDFFDPRGSVSAPAFVPTGAANEKSPTGGGDNTTSMAWFFDGTELAPGDSSSLLLFTSPNAPEYSFLTVFSGIAAQFPPPLVPSPGRLVGNEIPEPSTLLLALACGLPMLVNRRSR